MQPPGCSERAGCIYAGCEPGQSPMDDMACDYNFQLFIHLDGQKGTHMQCARIANCFLRLKQEQIIQSDAYPTATTNFYSHH